MVDALTIAMAVAVFALGLARITAPLPPPDDLPDVEWEL